MRKDVRWDTELSHHGGGGTHAVIFLRNMFDTVWGGGNPTLTSENEASQTLGLWNNLSEPNVFHIPQAVSASCILTQL